MKKITNLRRKSGVKVQKSEVKVHITNLRKKVGSKSTLLICKENYYSAKKTHITDSEGRTSLCFINYSRKILPSGIRKKFIRNSETGYDYLFKKNRLLFSRTNSHNLFLNFLQSNHSETGYRNTIFFPKRVVEILKNWTPRKVALLHFQNFHFCLK